jgi:hypothetical protein
LGFPVYNEKGIFEQNPISKDYGVTEKNSLLHKDTSGINTLKPTNGLVCLWLNKILKLMREFWNQANSSHLLLKCLEYEHKFKIKQMKANSTALRTKCSASFVCL